MNVWEDAQLPKVKQIQVVDLFKMLIEHLSVLGSILREVVLGGVRTAFLKAWLESCLIIPIGLVAVSCVCVCVHACARACTCVHTRAYWHVCMHVCMSAHAFVCTCLWSSEDNLGCHSPGTVCFDIFF